MPGVSYGSLPPPQKSQVKRILDDTHDKTQKIIEEKRETIESLAKLLLEKEVVDREEFKKLLQLPA